MTAGLGWLLAAAGLFLAWQTSGALLLIFAGLLFGSLLDACSMGIAYVVPLGRRWRLAIVCVLLLAGLGLGLVSGGYAIVAQANELARVLAEQFEELRRMARSFGLTPQHLGAAPDQSFTDLLLPDPSTLFGQAQTIFGTTLGVLGNAVVIGFLGLFVAMDPHLYRDGVVRLAPEAQRERFRRMLDDMALSLRWWLVGQLAVMVLVTASTWIALALIGMPSAFLLALIAGLLNFIPYLGPVLGGVPIGLAAMPQGMEMLAWALGAYVLIQTVEGYIAAPMIQRRAVDVAPAASLAGIVLFGSLFGGWGVALATPILAVLRIGLTALRESDAPQGTALAGPETDNR